MAEPHREMSTAEIAGRVPPPIPHDGGEHEEGGPSPLFTQEQADEFRRRWMDIQTGFVDDPRASVKSADGLVAETMKRLAEIFSNERSGLERQWDKGDQVSTEELRQAMQRYRSFFDRLLSI